MTVIISLTESESKRFSAWLKQDVESNRELVVQMEKLLHAEPVVKQKKQQMTACIIVARLLDSIEEQSILPSDPLACKRCGAYVGEEFLWGEKGCIACAEE